MSGSNAWDKLKELVQEMAYNKDLDSKWRGASPADKVKELLARGVTLADLYLWLVYPEKTKSVFDDAGVLAAGAIWMP